MGERDSSSTNDTAHPVCGLKEHPFLFFGFLIHIRCGIEIVLSGQGIIILALFNGIDKFGFLSGFLDGEV